MLPKYNRYMSVEEVVREIIYDSVDTISWYDFVGRKAEYIYDNEDIYELIKEYYKDDVEVTQESVNHDLKYWYTNGYLTPKVFKKYVKTFYDGVKLTNVKVNNWDDISFTVKFTAIEYSWWYKKLVEMRDKRLGICQ